MGRKILLAAVLSAPLMPQFSQAQEQSVFDDYFARAQTFAQEYPREKAYLHFDNTSYYQGDTIWFKAYVVTADDNKPSHISKPLYVDFVDQLGNIMDRQIIKLEEGEGEGFISLSNTYFTGYYEVRAYTKWMLAFSDDPQYFSRTIPIYRKRLTGDETSRSIAEYRMDNSMKQRPKQKLKKLNAYFYPEGGNLVQGVPSVVGFETLSEDEGWVNVSGFVLSEKGERLDPIATVHDGMGRFLYTPGEKPSNVELEYNGKTYKFKLPEALPSGYTIMVNSREKELSVSVTRSGTDPNEKVALFMFSHGTPCAYVPVEFGDNPSKHVRILTNDFPDGILHLSLINGDGQTLVDRLCFIRPDSTANISAEVDAAVYTPYSHAECKFIVTDATGNPVPGAHLSVAVRDALDNDYIKYDNSIFTDLLLTSELKGYINRPGFYFIDNSASRRKMLDNLMLIRGWRCYDTQESIGTKEFTPKYMPEPNLNLYGHIDSWYGIAQKNIGVTVLAHNDTAFVSGSTNADDEGNICLPIDDFYGKMEALIQTKREGKKYNRNALISIDRNFEPPLRNLDYDELNPVWDEPADTTALAAALEAFEEAEQEEEAKQEEDVHMLEEVVVKGKRKKRNPVKDTEKFERDILGYYNIRQYVDRLRDEGKLIVDDVGYLMHTINGKIDREGENYGTSEIKYSANGQDIEQVYLTGCIDMIETAMLYTDRTGLYSYTFGDDFMVDVEEITDIYTDSNMKMDTISQASIREVYVRCAFVMKDRWDAGKSYKPTHGIRRTEIQGYSVPARFYSPQYPEGMPNEGREDKRRTLYWNPNVVTDENGVATVEYYNGHNTTCMNICAETLGDGQPAAISFNTFAAARQ